MHQPASANLTIQKYTELLKQIQTCHGGLKDISILKPAYICKGYFSEQQRMRSLSTGGYSDFVFLQTFYMGFALYVPAIAFQAGKQTSNQSINRV